MPRTTESARAPGPFQLGDWLVEPDVCQLSRGDVSVQLQIRMMSVLVYLAQRAGDAVTRKEIFDAVWETEFVSDNALTHAVAAIRKALGDSAREPAYIETLHRKGYRLIAPVSGLVVRGHDPEERAACWLISGSSILPLPPGETVIGRGTEADVVIESPKASRRHARIVVDRDQAVIEDLGSTNGTWVNGERLVSPLKLTHGDEIQIGRDVWACRFASNDPDAATVASVAKPSSVDQG
jgi:DNA-binding winged helix-turn-helix (wHTH) protein